MTADSRQSSSPTNEPEAPPGGASATSWFGAITQALNVAGTVLILVMVVAVNADVIGRDFFNHPIPGVLEFIGLSIVTIVFLQMANTLREGRHVSNDLLTQLIAHWRPRIAAGIYAIFNLIGAGLMALIVFYMWPLLKRNYLGGFYAGTAGVIEIPIWPFMVAVVIGAVATFFQFLVFAWRDVQRVRRDRPFE